MILLPAIDLKDGKCVRLQKGAFETAHQVADSALETAAAFAAAGARWVHMVDLDGARDGVRKNAAIVAQVAKDSGLKVELGGGIRSMADLEAVFALGIERAVIGSAAVGDPDFVHAAVEWYGERIAVGIDALDGIVKTAGWERSSGLDCLKFAGQMEGIGVKTIIFTDIATDGMLTGPSFERLKRLQENYSGQIVASGGVSTNQDLRDLSAMGLYGAIIGKAYYAGTVDLEKAVSEMDKSCSCRVVADFVRTGDSLDFLHNVYRMEDFVSCGLIELSYVDGPDSVDDIPFHMEEEDYYTILRYYFCPKCGKRFEVGWCCRGRPMLKEC